MTQDDRTGGSRKAVGGDLIIPVAGLIFTLYYFSTILESPWEAQVAAFFVGFILIGLILIFLVKTGVLLARGTTRLDFSPLVTPVGITLKRLVLFALTLGFMLLIPYFGFTFTTFLFLAAAFLLLQQPKRPVLAIGFAAGLSLAGYVLFIVAFDTRFPRGPFEEMMRGIL
jgi:hypothetical protein